MTLSMYQASVPVFIQGLINLSAILTKAENYATAKKIEPSVLINSRLAPDMFALARQVQIATDIVKGGVSRLAAVEVPSYADTETTFEELQARVAKTIAYLKTFDAKKVDGSEDRKISLKVGGNELDFDGQSYLLGFVIPNFYFHIVTTYGILRHNGLDIGKKDFLGSK